MASRLPKLRQWIVSCAVFIFLSVSSAEERTRCYWCGPLSEQVHRSARAPSCDIFHLEQHETLCDHGYTHCAIVAASPPYAESRLCVKFYQDECYSLYCNSTKTWRMVCACRGDLCNGPRTARETQAFALLPKSGKTKPRKRNLISHFISIKTKTPNEDHIDIVISKENETIYNIQGDQPSEYTNLYTPTPKREEDNIIIIHGTPDSEENINHTSLMNAESSDESKIHSVDATISATEDHNVTKTDKEFDKAEVSHVNSAVNNHFNNVDKGLVNSDTGTHLDNFESDKHLNNSTNEAKKNANTSVNRPFNNSEINKHDNIEVDKTLENTEHDNNLGNKLTNAEMDKPATGTTAAAAMVEVIKVSQGSTTTMKPTVEIAVQSSVTPAKLPPAEALQQNVTPTKAMEVTTMGTTAMSTENHHIETTLATEVHNPNKKNSGTRNLAHLIVYVMALFVRFCI